MCRLPGVQQLLQPEQTYLRFMHVACDLSYLRIVQKGRLHCLPGK
jgi:hypothetical protein